jgi:hypothetical protein
MTLIQSKMNLAKLELKSMAARGIMTYTKIAG